MTSSSGKLLRASMLAAILLVAAAIPYPVPGRWKGSSFPVRAPDHGAVPEEPVKQEPIQEAAQDESEGPAPSRHLLQNIGSYTGVKANYSSVLNLAWLFYEAQRSGYQPVGGRIIWKGDSHTKDKVVGGWYDAGDTLKLNYPMAMSVSYLAWSILNFQGAYVNSGALRAAIDNLRWATDYLVGCHLSDNQYVGQIGNVNVDHSYSGRPETDPSARPAYIWDQTMPASDLVAVVSAALTSSSLVFSTVPAPYQDTAYAANLLAHAKTLYNWGKVVKGSGLYNTAFPVGTIIYESYTGYKDKLMYAAVWLFKATKDPAFLDQALYYWNDSGSYPSIYVGYDCAYAPAVNLLLDLSAKGVTVPGLAKYQNWMTTQFLPNWFNANGQWSIYKTPKGLVIVVWDFKDPSQPWASLRTVMNIAFQMVLYANLPTTAAATKAQAINFAKSQMDYALGFTGLQRSFVTGWGTNPPTHVHHRAASCPLRDAPCSWDNFNSPNPNPQILYGALVGGPGKNDYYSDVRSDYYHNEPSVDSNAGFIGTLAGLLTLV